MRIPRPSYWLTRSKGGDGDDRGSYSLFGEILDWMLAPLLFLWPISIVLTYDVASNIANKPYDQALADQVRAISRQLRFTRDGDVRVELTSSASRLIRADAEDTIYYQIISPEGMLLAGDPEVPAIGEEDEPATTSVRYRNGDIQGDDIRIAYMASCTDAESRKRCATIQVAETLHKRNGLSSQIISGVLLPQFAIIPLALVLVWFGLTHGIAPLNRLQGVIRERRPGDLSPVEPRNVPEEVRPLIIAFNDMMARLEHNLAAQQRFIADAAHQMRTPVAGLRIQAELALSESDPEQMRQGLQNVLTGAERAARLINQLLALARVEASTEKVDVFGSVDLDALLRDVVADLVPAALVKGIDLGIDDKDSPSEGEEDGESESVSETENRAEVANPPLTLDANPILLRELISNLVDNAIKYTPGGGRVTASAHIAPDDSNYALLLVEDDGPGIPPEARERVFERFYRALGTSVEGSGLGLAIVREVVELHAGSIRVIDSMSHRGACFEVRLPLHRAVEG